MRLLPALIVGLVGAVVGGAIVAVVALPQDDVDEEPAPIPTDVATVVRTDLVETETLPGTLRFRDATDHRASVPGVVTAMPEAGSSLTRGDVAFEIDGLPVFAFYGDRPAWRPFSDGMTDGADIVQLELNLTALGHAPDGMEIDAVFDDDTETAIEAFQEELGLEVTGVIELGRIVFVDGERRIGDSLLEVGSTANPGVTVLTTTSLDQEVAIELDPDDLDLVAIGDQVTVTLPDGREVAGSVEEIGRVVRRTGPEPDASEVLDVVVLLEGSASGLDRAPVDVDVESGRAAGVLAVPVSALLALADGGYALEVLVDDGTQLVGVTLGEFADGLVEVTGEVDEGDRVVVPG